MPTQARVSDPSSRSSPGSPPESPKEARAGSSPAGGSADAPAGGRPSGRTLHLELYRQHTLLQVMTARMRETATALENGATPDESRLRRALDVHHRFLVEVHRTDEERVTRFPPHSTPTVALATRTRCDLDHEGALQFETHLEGALKTGAGSKGDRARALGVLFREEADRIDRHVAWEEDAFTKLIDESMSRTDQARLLRDMRRFDAARVDAEIALVSWASNLHPSSD